MKPHIRGTYITCIQFNLLIAIEIQCALKNDGIASAVYYPRPPHLTDPCRSFGYHPGDFPVTEQASREVLSIPLYPEMSEEQVNFVLETVQQILEKEHA